MTDAQKEQTVATTQTHINNLKARIKKCKSVGDNVAARQAQRSLTYNVKYLSTLQGSN